MPFLITEAPPTDRSAFDPRGAAREFWRCREHEVMLSGPAECVAGETRIYDPTTGEHVPIAQLQQQGLAPTVLTKQGPAHAEVPFIKGTAALFRVTTADGGAFLATRRHRVLTRDGWTFVSDLRIGQSQLAFEPRLLPSTPESSPLVSREDGECWCRISPDSPDRYSRDLRPCDARPLWGSGTGQALLPSRSGAPALGHDCRRTDDRASGPEHSHACRASCLPSSGYCDRRAGPAWVEEFRDGSATLSPEPCSCRPPWISQTKTCQGRPSRSLSDCDGHTIQGDDSSVQDRLALQPSGRVGAGFPADQPSVALISSPHTPSESPIAPLASNACIPSSFTSYSDYTNLSREVQWSRVRSIEFVRVDRFYDLHVPGAGHYLAEGFWHHNTGKTFTCCHKLDALLWKYPRSKAVMLRKTQTSLYGTVLATYRKIVGTETPIKFYGGEKPEWADYPNGSRLYFAGMDNPQKALSSERDFIYANQAEELLLSDWEVLTTRCTGRAANAPYAQILGDCNPGPPNHWIKQRTSLRLFESRHEDNPTLYDDQGVITERGRTTMAVLEALTGIRYLRLKKGLWVGGEGQWFTAYDPELHVSEQAEWSPNLDVVLALDSGVHTGAVFFQVNDSGMKPVVNVFADYYAEGLGVEENAAAILAIARERCEGRIDRPLTDPSGGDRNPSGPAVIELYRQAGLTLGKWIKGPGSVVDGLAVIEDYLGSPASPPRLFIHPRCGHMTGAFANYTRKKQAGQWIDKPEDPQHPYEDLMDALRGGLYQPTAPLTTAASPVSGNWRG